MTEQDDGGIDSEFVEILGRNTEAQWQPIVGRETTDLLNHLEIQDASKKTLIEEANRILSRCVPPRTTSHGSNIGLVIGYVQSGKTMSFTTVAALARDNGYRIVIVITGISTILTEQSTRRLKNDLRLESRIDRKWHFFVHPRRDAFHAIRDTLADWEDPNVPNELCQTVLITTMKHHTHLRHITSLLRMLDLSGVPTLIIDDEGDQASLNALVNRDGESTTYRRILELRRQIPHRSYLQYTATPQAPLLINIIDLLSPEFAEVLVPGGDYTGGEEFFINRRDLLVRIPEHDRFRWNNPPTEPPNSLIDAMRIFFVGAAAGMVLDFEAGNRTMLVHPSHRTTSHGEFVQWARNVKNLWVQILSLDLGDPDRNELLEEFKIAYNNLSQTVHDLPPFEKIAPQLPRSIRKTDVLEVNATSGRTPTVDWNSRYAHILVGGQAMDRGFTVEGLTVTYMPRGIGIGNADTIQQRARFLGYKRDYLGYCRLFLDAASRDAYTQYVEHEASIREELIQFQRTGRSLFEWRRQFLMPNRLRPTRLNVIDIQYTQGQISNAWYIPKAPHYTEEVGHSNRQVVDKLLANLSLTPDAGNPDRTTMQKHMVNDDVKLQFVHEQLLVRYKINSPNDTQRYTGLLLQVRDYLEDYPDETCSIYQMSCRGDIWTTRRRSLNENGEIVNLMQGPHPNRQGRIYPGDRGIGDQDRLIIQIHRLDLEWEEADIAKDILNIAIWMPLKMAIGWLIQDQDEDAYP